MAEKDTLGTLDKLVNVVQGYKQEDQSGKGGWIAAAIAGIVALITIAVLAWRAWKRGKERAKLLHEKAVREEKAHQAEVTASIEEDQEEKEKAVRQADELRKEVDKLEDEADTLETKRKNANDLIDKISSWEDVDEIVK